MDDQPSRDRKKIEKSAPKHPVSGGVELTPELLENLADEAERGFDPQQVRRRPPVRPS